jgi:hypothetical protein
LQQRAEDSVDAVLFLARVAVSASFSCLSDEDTILNLQDDNAQRREEEDGAKRSNLKFKIRTNDQSLAK